jgi:hypothetical protein
MLVWDFLLFLLMVVQYKPIRTIFITAPVALKMKLALKVVKNDFKNKQLAILI